MTAKHTTECMFPDDHHPDCRCNVSHLTETCPHGALEGECPVVDCANNIIGVPLPQDIGWEEKLKDVQINGKSIPFKYEDGIITISLPDTE